MHYFIRQMWSNIQTSWGIALQAVLVMSIAFLLLGAFGLLSLQVESVLQHWEREAPVIVYVQDHLEPIQRAKLEQEIQKYKEIKGFRAVSPKESMRRMRKALGKKGTLLDGLDVPLLSASIEIDLQPWARSSHALKQIQKGLSKLKGVQEVDVGQKWFAPLWSLVGWVRLILWGGSILLLFCACLIAAGTIRLALFMHQDEIEIMRLLGATEGFIRFPFFLEGAVKGLLASGCSLLILYTFFVVLEGKYGASFQSFTSIPLVFFNGSHTTLLLIGGMLSGAIGSWLAFLGAPHSTHVHTSAH